MSKFRGSRSSLVSNELLNYVRIHEGKEYSVTFLEALSLWQLFMGLLPRPL
jgi:hypothetical protein